MRGRAQLQLILLSRIEQLDLPQRIAESDNGIDGHTAHAGLLDSQFEIVGRVESFEAAITRAGGDWGSRPLSVGSGLLA